MMINEVVDKYYINTKTRFKPGYKISAIFTAPPPQTLSLQVHQNIFWKTFN